MKNKIFYVVVAILVIASLIIITTNGFNVGMVYEEGVTVSITEDTKIEESDAIEIASQIWTDKNFIIQRVEYYDDCVMIKVKEASNEQLEQLVKKFNEKYNAEKTLADLTVEHVSNVKIGTLIEPYIVPVGMSTLIILAYYAVRFKGAKQMVLAIRNLIIAGGLLFSVYAIGRIPVNELTMPVVLSVYILTIAVTTAVFESKKKKE